MFCITLVVGREDREGEGKDDLRKLRHGNVHYGGISSMNAQCSTNSVQLFCSLICQNSSKAAYITKHQYCQWQKHKQDTNPTTSRVLFF